MDGNSLGAGGGLTEEKNEMYEVRLRQITDSLALVTPMLAFLVDLGGPFEPVATKQPLRTRSILNSQLLVNGNDIMVDATSSLVFQQSLI